eukprot:gene29817-36928_t
MSRNKSSLSLVKYISAVDKTSHVSISESQHMEDRVERSGALSFLVRGSEHPSGAHEQCRQEQQSVSFAAAQFFWGKSAESPTRKPVLRPVTKSRSSLRGHSSKYCSVFLAPTSIKNSVPSDLSCALGQSRELSSSHSVDELSPSETVQSRERRERNKIVACLGSLPQSGTVDLSLPATPPRGMRSSSVQ